ncbi:hypothetical protein [Oscillibacter ruminantium]|uniref:hypothetical protein n=1 Tax=Oscillibacter ruminantium TaxID=1263547 RepID=UPI00058C66AE|nr:hypothetical protein [Oscillibacter ruminantium]
MGECILAGHPQGSKIGYGTYTGDGQETRTISLGVTPKWVLVAGIRAQADQDFWGGSLAIAGSPQYYSQGAVYQVFLEIVTGGFSVAFSQYVRTNVYGQKYNYIYGT